MAKEDASILEIDQNTARAAHRFHDYLNVRDDPKPADVIFILGGSSIKPVEKAAQLYKEGFTPKIAFISQGGQFGGEKIWGMSEVDKYKQILVELDIPDKAIICQIDPEKQTRNTLAEAQAAIPFLKEQGINPNKVILVSRPIHQRRAFSTFKKQYPYLEYINCPAEEPLNLNDPEEVTRLVQEAERLLDYGVKKEDIERPNISPEIIRAAATVRRYLKKTGIYQPRIKPQ